MTPVSLSDEQDSSKSVGMRRHQERSQDAAKSFSQSEGNASVRASSAMRRNSCVCGVSPAGLALRKSGIVGKMTHALTKKMHSEIY